MDHQRVTVNNPPVFDGTTESFHVWLRNVRLWNDMTDIPPPRRGPLVVLNLHGRAAQLAEAMERELLVENGVEYVCQFLEANYLINRFYHVSDVFREFLALRRKPMSQNDATGSDPMDTYLTRFHSLGHRLFQLGFQIPEHVLTFLLIEHAKLTNDQRSNVMTFLLSNQGAQYSYHRAAQALRQLVIVSPPPRHTSTETGLLVDAVFSENVGFSDEEVGLEFPPDDTVPGEEEECFYVRRRNKFFRRRFYNKKGKSGYKGQYNSPSYFEHYSSYPDAGYHSVKPTKGFKGKSFGKGKNKYSGFGKKGKGNPVYAVETTPNPEQSTSTSSASAYRSLPTMVDDWSSWYCPEYEYEFWSDENYTGTTGF